MKPRLGNPGLLAAVSVSNKGFLQCKNTGAGTLAPKDAVALGLAAYTSDMDFVPVQKATAGDKIVGLVTVDSATATAVNGKVLVQITGPATASVDGTTDVAAGDRLKAHASTDGALEKDATATANLTNPAVAQAARTANSVGDLTVILTNPYGFVPSQ